MPVRLPFSIQACSGEDPEFPATELLYHSADRKGWCTPRFCQYPQELTLRLEAAARLTQIQLLSHEFKIVGKVELLVGTFEGPGGGAMSGNGSVGIPAPSATAADPSKATWRRLGFLAFDTNEGSGFSARELKSVALNGVPAQLLRLVIHRCHANAANAYGQVSLVAINLMGEPLGPTPLSPITNTGGPYATLHGGLPPGMLPPQAAGMGLGHPMQSPQQYMQPPQAHLQHFMPPPPQPQQQQRVPSPAEAAAALAAELGVDAVTAQRIADLQQQKQQAVEREDYDEAKRLKGAVDRLRAAGGAIAGLEARKAAAVEQEDYDLAKQLKVEIDRHRAKAYAAALSGHGDGEDAFSPPRSRRASAVGGAPAPLGAARLSEGGSGHASGEPSAAQRHAAAAVEGGGDDASPPAGAAARRRQLPAGSPSGSDWNAYDERPAMAKGAYSIPTGDEASQPTASRRSSMPGAAARASASHGSDAGPAPAGFPSDLPSPEALSAVDAKDAGPLAEVAGEYLARCVFSRTWQLREAALVWLAKELEGGRMEGGSDNLRTLMRVLLRTLRDKVVAVCSASLAALRALVAAQAGACPPRDLQAALGELLPVLAEKAADLNQRTREQATEALVALAGVPEAGLRSATAPFLRAPKAGAAWKVVLGRLQLVSALLPVIGMAGEGSSEGFPLGPLMGFVGPALSNSSAEVRGAAVALTVQVALLAGPSVQRLLPTDLNPKVREQIEQGMLSGAVPAPAAAKPPSSAARGGATASSARPQQAAAAAAGAKPAGAPQRQAAAKPPPLHQQQQQQQEAGGMQPTPAVAGLAAEDEASVYEGEVRAREARLGPSHPDVAEAVSNLAILYNQRGDAGRALPLYERALAIWEAACGPDSPDVAHTLTDIAVIHLEQGRDDIGRPLLQRALRIQEAHLGPAHPDVAAIRDVLMEDELGAGRP